MKKPTPSMSGATPPATSMSIPKRGSRLRTVCESAIDVNAWVNGSKKVPFFAEAYA
jgi:hypothetical protein